jgi:hypothetical protein
MVFFFYEKIGCYDATARFSLTGKIGCYRTIFPYGKNWMLPARFSLTGKIEILFQLLFVSHV